MQDKQTIRAVLVGCGAISKVWFEAAKTISQLEIVGLVDIVEEAARQKAAGYALHNVIIGSDVASVLDCSQPDVVFNCTIPAAHYNVTLEALKHGCHVLSEKPMAETMEQARAMIAMATQAGKLFVIVQNRRYDSNIRRLRALLASGSLGPLTTVNSDFYIGAHFRDFRDHLRHILLLDMAIHTFDAARLLTGADPISVYCKEWNPAGSWYDRDASAIAIFEMTGGIVYTYRGSWCSEGLPTTWESDWRVIGQQGSVRWDGGEHLQAQVVAREAGLLSNYQNIQLPALTPDMHIGGHAGVMREFVDCVRAGRQPETICTDNSKSLAMVFGAIESAESGQQVAISW